MNQTELAIIRSDYFSSLADFGLNHELVENQVKEISDLNDKKIDGIKIKKSEVHGLGVFAEKDYKKGKLICLAKKEGKRTLAGRYTNHSPLKNGAYYVFNNNIWLMAAEDIKKNDEIFVNYRQTLSLQVDRPELVKVHDSMTELSKKRFYLNGVDAAAYDLLLNQDHIDHLTVMERVIVFENLLKQLPQVDIPVIHEFIPGMYRRQITFKKGTFATGKIHRDECFDVVLSGEMIVVSDDGFKRVKGPCTMTSQPGKKKAGYALTDCTWINYHPTSCTTVEDVEKEIFVDEIETLEVQKCAV